LFSIDILLETIATHPRQLGRCDAALDLPPTPIEQDNDWPTCPCADENLHRSIDREKVIGRDCGIQRKKGTEDVNIADEPVGERGRR